MRKNVIQEKHHLGNCQCNTQKIICKGETEMFTYETENGYCTITGVVGRTTESIEIPATIDGCEVCSISAGAFKEHEEVKQVKLPNTVKKIGRSAFAGCKNLEMINLDFV